MASADLIWMLTRKQNCFIRQKRGSGGDPLFTAEPNNLMGSHSYKYSGLANKNIVGVEEHEVKGCVLSVKSTKDGCDATPATTFQDIELTKDFKKVAKTIGSITKRRRPDLVSAALTRWYKLNRGQKAAAK